MVPANYAITIPNIFVSEHYSRNYQVSQQENIYMLICQQWALQTCSKDIQCRMSREDPETIMLTTESIQARSVSESSNTAHISSPFTAANCFTASQSNLDKLRKQMLQDEHAV